MSGQRTFALLWWRLALSLGLLLVCLAWQGWALAWTARGASSAHAAPALLQTTAVWAPDWMSDSDQPAAEYGTAVSLSGDVNGDGYADLLIGSPKYDSGAYKGGSAFLFTGGEEGLAAGPVWQAGSDQKGSRFGAAVSSAGDVNGDGYADLLVGAYRYADGDLESEEGRLYLYAGGAGGPAVAPCWMAESNWRMAHLGYAVVAADVNGDGYGDVLAGAPGYADGGALFLFFGSAAGPSTVPDQIIPGGQANARYGTVLAAAGDVNKDGFADVIVGAPFWDDAYEHAGAAFLYLGSATGLVESPAWQVVGANENAHLATAVAGIGDVNQDGFTDVAVGAPGAVDAATGASGAAYVYFGHTGGLTGFPMWTARGGNETSSFGSALAAADLNGDAWTDLIVGAPLFSGDQSAEGAAFVYPGAPGGLAAAPSSRAEGNKADTDFGRALAAGLSDGDACADLVVGAPLFRYETLIYGRVFAYYGRRELPDLNQTLYLPFVLSSP